jgi:hypothetical protein
VTLPVLGTIRSWQFVLMALLIAALMFSFPEPKRTAER